MKNKESVNLKDKMIMFILGLLVGAIISTASIYFYTVANSSNDMGRMNGNPPSMPNGQNNGGPIDFSNMPNNN